MKALITVAPDSDLDHRLFGANTAAKLGESMVLVTDMGSSRYLIEGRLPDVAWLRGQPDIRKVEMEYSSLCMTCELTVHNVMLTTYCLTAMRCDGCGNTADLALTRWQHVAFPDEKLVCAIP